MTRRLQVLLFAVLLLTWGCAPTQEENPRLSLFVGVDVSGSFTRSPEFRDGMKFLSYYLYGHLNGIGGLEKPRALFIGSIGGNTPNEPKAFYPIQVFERKSASEIDAKLRELFSIQGNYLTDFNAFFKRVSEVVQKRGLVLAPLTIVVVSDGIPDFRVDGRVVEGVYDQIDVSSLEYLARNVTIRVLYPTPKVATEWERTIPRTRVRIWTVAAEIMEGWHEQLEQLPSLEEEKRFWKWVQDIVDHRVRRQRIF
ncbi:MAG: hypothetical protein ACE5JN_11335 [Candidatus Methylomirabilia bacterium]